METSDNILLKTLKTMGVMVGACVAFVGTLTLIALVIVRSAVGPSEKDTAPGLVPASKIEGQRPLDTPPKKSEKADLPPRANRAI
jgi:hypothetical protein